MGSIASVGLPEFVSDTKHLPLRIFPRKSPRSCYQGVGSLVKGNKELAEYLEFLKVKNEEGTPAKFLASSKAVHFPSWKPRVEEGRQGQVRAHHT